ncbi:MAG: hypothetical protein RL215_3206, partial [Planctomycetota bacterium]
GSGGDAIDDDFDVVLVVSAESWCVGEGNDLSIDACAEEAFFLEVFEEVAEFAFLVLHEGCEDLEASSCGLCEEAVDDLVGGLGLNGFSGDVAVTLSDTREEDAEVVVDFGDGADGTAGIAAGGFLLDGDGGRESGDGIDVGFGHLPEELSGVGGEGFDVAALSFGV